MAVTVLILLVVNARPIWFKVRLLMAQQACMRFEDERDLPIFVRLDEEPLGRLCAAHRQLKRIPFDLRCRAGRIAPSWERLSQLFNVAPVGPRAPVATLFVGELRTAAGLKRLVAIDVIDCFDNGRNLSFVTHVITPAGLFSSAKWSDRIDGSSPSVAVDRPLDDSAGVNVVFLWENADELAIYPGRVRADDPSTFDAIATLKQSSDDADSLRERITGRLFDDGTVLLQASGKHTAAIRRRMQLDTPLP